MGFIKEFKDFAMRGNVVDMAVGIIIGAAFGKIVSSMVADIVTPVIGIFGKADFSNLYVPVTPAAAEKINAAREKAEAAGLPFGLVEARKEGSVFAYGNFVTEVINFIIVAFAIFLIIKFINTAQKRFEKQQAAAPAAPPAPTKEELLLTDIRDLLARKV